ncbi:MAG: response regulator transcription factor [Bacteroidota bacterium]
MIRIVIAEDHISLIEGIKLFLEFEDNIKVIGHATNGKELLSVVNKLQPDMVICDIRMPIIDGITAVKEIRKSSNSIKIIAFSMFDQENAVSKMIGAGANGYILKNSSLSELLKAIRLVAEGNQYFDPNILSKAKQPKGAKLSKRQIEILNLIITSCIHC